MLPLNREVGTSRTSDKGTVYDRHTIASGCALAPSRAVQPLFHPRRATRDSRQGRRPAHIFAADRGAIEAKPFATA